MSSDSSEAKEPAEIDLSELSDEELFAWLEAELAKAPDTEKAEAAAGIAAINELLREIEGASPSSAAED